MARACRATVCRAQLGADRADASELLAVTAERKQDRQPYEFNAKGSTNNAINVVAPSCNQASDARRQTTVGTCAARAPEGMA
jgi:hypothetical protein